ncbi:MAG TPA: hypothetical protein VGI42_01745 [Chthoniobacterales bacterium]
MKTLFASFLCLLFAVVQTLAISGGPNYGGPQVRTTGTYAGLFVPTGNENSLGIFSATIPKTGVGNGSVAFFRNGVFYPGTFQGLADPDSAVLTGVVSSSFNITFTSQTDAMGKTTNTVITFNANGRIDGQIRPNANRFSTASARIVGTAQITYTTVGSGPGIDLSNANSGSAIPYQVSGFKQAEAQ